MTVILILSGIIIGVGILLYLHDRVTRRDVEAAEQPAEEPGEENSGECCGLHIVCEKDSLVGGLDREILYYDDEELDRYRGREANDYEIAEIEEFREVLLTLRPEEIAGWARSITARGITLPTDVREELLMIVAEARQNR